MSVPETAPPAANPKRYLPWLVAVAFFMESLDTTILNTAVPTISGDLAVTALSLKSVLTTYTLSLAVFIPISGWMADRFGTRAVFRTAVGLFTLGSLLCGLSVNLHMLVAARLVQGIGVPLQARKKGHVGRGGGEAPGEPVGAAGQPLGRERRQYAFGLRGAQP